MVRDIVDYGASSDNLATSLATETQGVCEDTGYAFAMISNSCFASSGVAAGSTANKVNDDLSVTCLLTDATTITMTRPSGGENVDYRYHFEAWEYTGPAGGANEFVVRYHASLSLGPGTLTLDTAIAGVATIADCVAFVTGDGSDENTANWDSACVRASIVDSGGAVLRLTREDSTGTATVSVAVVEFTGASWSVQQVSHDQSVTDVVETEAITAVTWTRSFIVSSYSGTSANQTAMVPLAFAGATTTTIKFYGASTTNQVAFIVSNADITVQHANSVDGGASTLAAGSASPQSENFAVTDVEDMRRTSVIARARQTNAADTNYSQAFWGYYLARRDRVTFWRGRHRTTDTSHHATQVIQFDTERRNAKSDTVFYSRSPDGTIADLLDDLSQLSTDLASQTTYGEELSSARTNLLTSRTIEATIYISIVDTSDDGTIVDRSSAVGGEETFRLYTEVLAATAPDNLIVHISQGDSDITTLACGSTSSTYHIRWAMSPNPDTTVAGNAQLSFLSVFGEESESYYFKQVTHAVPTTGSTWDFTLGAQRGGTTTFGGEIRSVRVSSAGPPQGHGDAEWAHDHWRARARARHASRTRVEPPVPDRSSGLGDDGAFAGPIYATTAAAIRRNDMRLVSPLVNEVYWNPPTMDQTNDPVYFARLPPGETSGWEMMLQFLRLRRVSDAVNRLRVKVFAQLWATSGSPKELEVRCYSMNRIPGVGGVVLPGFAPPQSVHYYVAESNTTDDTSGGLGRWLGGIGRVYTSRLRIARDNAGRTYLCLAFRVDRGSADSTTRFRVKAWSVEPESYDDVTGGIPLDVTIGDP